MLPIEKDKFIKDFTNALISVGIAIAIATALKIIEIQRGEKND